MFAFTMATLHAMLWIVQGRKDFTVTKVLSKLASPAVGILCARQEGSTTGGSMATSIWIQNRTLYIHSTQLKDPNIC